MSPSFSIVLPFAVALMAWAGTWFLQRHAPQQLLDLPNERSSHSRSTPRGGGLGLAVAHLLGVLIAGLLSDFSRDLGIALLGGGLLVAAIGLRDDFQHVDASRRLICHLLACIWASWWLGGLPPVDFGWGAVDLGLPGAVLLVACLAWFLNLFNFMDGIDGLAGAQAITMAASASVLVWVVTNDVSAALPLVLLAAATAGFLAWNWPPAKIFMGDVGSGYLGFALGVLGLWTVAAGWLTVWVWLIAGGAFLADATVTLLTRAVRRTRLAEAHRSHAYQRLSRYWGSHRAVTGAFIAVNCLWLGPWALLAATRPELGAACTVAAIGPLFMIAARLGAGRPGDLRARE